MYRILQSKLITNFSFITSKFSTSFSINKRIIKPSLISNSHKRLYSVSNKNTDTSTNNNAATNVSSSNSTNDLSIISNKYISLRKYDKAHRTKVKCRLGGSLRGTYVKYLDYGIQVKQPIILKHSVLQACEQLLKRLLKNNSTDGGDNMYLFRQYAVFPYTKKPLNSKMGKGKGPVSYYGARVQKNKIVLEFGSVSLNLANLISKQINYLMPCKTKLVSKPDNLVQ